VSATSWPADSRQTQALARAVVLYRAEGRRFLEATLELLGPVGYADVKVEDVAAAGHVHEATARRWLRRFSDDGVLYWASKVGRGAVSRIGLVPLSARVSRFVARVVLKDKIFNLQDWRSTHATRGFAAVAASRRLHYERRSRREARLDELRERMRVLRIFEEDVLPWLWDSDELTHVSFGRLILTCLVPITEEKVRQFADGEEAGYVYEAFRNAGNGR
jgi:hypothetical protein